MRNHNNYTWLSLNWKLWWLLCSSWGQGILSYFKKSFFLVSGAQGYSTMTRLPQHPSLSHVALVVLSELKKDQPSRKRAGHWLVSLCPSVSGLILRKEESDFSKENYRSICVLQNTWLTRTSQHLMLDCQSSCSVRKLLWVCLLSITQLTKIVANQLITGVSTF